MYFVIPSGEEYSIPEYALFISLVIPLLIVTGSRWRSSLRHHNHGGAEEYKMEKRYQVSRSGMTA